MTCRRRRLPLSLSVSSCPAPRPCVPVLDTGGSRERARPLRARAHHSGGVHRPARARSRSCVSAALGGHRDRRGDCDRAVGLRLGRGRPADRGARPDRPRVPALPLRPRDRLRKTPRAAGRTGGARLRHLLRPGGGRRARADHCRARWTPRCSSPSFWWRRRWASSSRCSRTQGSPPRSRASLSSRPPRSPTSER